MKRIALILVVLVTQAVWAQDWARTQLAKSPRHREWVTVKHDGRSVETFVVYPESKDKRPVGADSRDLRHVGLGARPCRPGSAAGYIAVAPDLLSGMGPNGGRSSDVAPDKVTEVVSHLNPDQVTADLNAVSDYAKKLPASNGKLFVGGFCWGGGQTFRFATNRPIWRRLLFSTGRPPDKDAMTRIKAPVYGFYAGNDARIDATLPDTTAQMKAAGKTFDPVVYDGAGHGFMRAGEAPDANDANKKARQDAWSAGVTCWENNSSALPRIAFENLP